MLGFRRGVVQGYFPRLTMAGLLFEREPLGFEALADDFRVNGEKQTGTAESARHRPSGSRVRFDSKKQTDTNDLYFKGFHRTKNRHHDHRLPAAKISTGRDNNSKSYVTMQRNSSSLSERNNAY